MIERVMPHSLEAEQSALGAMMMERDAIARAIELLTAEDFYRELHRKIFGAMLTLFDKGEPVDLFTLAEELRRRGQLAEVGGVEYLTALIYACPSAANVEAYAKVVAQTSRLRELAAAGNAIEATGFDVSAGVEDGLAAAQKRLAEIADKLPSQSVFSIGALAREVCATGLSAAENPNHVSGLATGFTAIDELTGGLQKSDLIVVAARPSMGKTQLCLQIAFHAARAFSRPVIFFSLEMSREQLTKRLLANQAHLDSRNLRTWQLSDGEWERLDRAAAQMETVPLEIVDKPAMTISEMRAICRRIAARSGEAALIVVDYIQLAKSGGRFSNRVEEVSEITRQLKQMAREANAPVIALSQLSRKCEDREDKRPINSDLRESGSIEQDADIVAFIYREAYYRRKGFEHERGGWGAQPESSDEAEIIFGKYRSGATATVKLDFVPQFARFENSYA